MIALLSPAKTLDFDPVDRDLPWTNPAFPGDTRTLVKRARELTPQNLRDLMHISEDLAVLNHQRFRTFKLTPGPEVGKAAVLAFKGDVYLGLDAVTLGDADVAYAQDHLRLLSGLYGVLRPLDRIQPHRLEMGSVLGTARGKNLYQFWGSKIAKALKKDLAGHPERTVVNLASNEYFKAVDTKALGARVVTPVFKEIKDGKAQVISFVAKRSRGAMARHLIEARVTDPEALRDYRAGGYRFQPAHSTGDTWEFHRKFVPVGG